MYCNEAARSVWRNTSPIWGARPFGSRTAAVDGQPRRRSSCFLRLAALRGGIGETQRRGRGGGGGAAAAAGARGAAGPHRAERVLPAMLAHEEFGVERLWPGTEPGDRHDFALFGVVDHDRRDTGKIDKVYLQNPARDAGSAPGVDRVAARLQNIETGRRGKVMTGGDRVPGHGDRGAMGGIMRGRGPGFSSREFAAAYRVSRRALKQYRECAAPPRA